MTYLVESSRKLCAACHVCDFMPVQVSILSEEPEGVEDAPLLVIDDKGQLPVGGLYTSDVLGLPRELFTYTRSVRCSPNGDLSILQTSMARAKNHCSVWTHMLADNRLGIISTRAGLDQLDIDPKFKEGDIFKTAKWGVVLCIPPIGLFMGGSEVKMYQSKVARLLKETGLAVSVAKMDKVLA